MNRETLRKLIERWMDAVRIIGRMREINGCGSSASAYEPALNAALDDILALLETPDVRTPLQKTTPPSQA